MQASPKTRDRAKALRAKLSPPEVKLWLLIRHRDPEKPTFRRQHPVGPFILDFYCAKAKLAVEIDGWSHNMGDPTRDERRDAWLLSQGIRVVRYTAKDVFRDPGEIAG